MIVALNQNKVFSNYYLKILPPNLHGKFSMGDIVEYKEKLTHFCLRSRIEINYMKIKF